LYLSLDPAMRGWIRETKSYIEPVPIGAVMRGATIAEVVESKAAEFAAGDKLIGMNVWAEYSVVRAEGLRKLPANLPLPLTAFLSVLGGTGLTAYFGLLDVGRPTPGETVVVSTAAGAVGSAVGQIAKLKGCRAVGIAGSDEKCRWIEGELGFDKAINYKTEKLAPALAAACPQGIDVYFDNVGGEQLEAALSLINLKARVVICGAISQYNNVEPAPGPRNYLTLLFKRARMEGFILFDYAPRFMEGVMQLGHWVLEGKLKYREDIVEGLENAPRALRKLFDGTNQGKLIVQIAAP
jgi:NADPH-dependent curcumin reductase CurA